MLDSSKKVGKYRKRSRRCNGEGSIAKRSDGRFQGSLMVEGTRKYVYGKTRAECLKKLDELRERVKRGQPLDGDVTVLELSEHYVETYAKGFVRSSTLANYLGYIENHIRNHPIAMTMVSKLTRDQVQLHVNGLTRSDTGEPVSQKTQRNYVQFLKSVLETAVDNGLAASNAADKVKLKKCDKKKRPILTSEDVQRQIQAADGHRWQIGLELLQHGMRISELLGLRASSIIKVDDIACLNIVHALKREYDFDAASDVQRTKLVLSEPKTAGSVRILPILPSVQAKLEQYLAYQREQAAGSFGLYEDDPFIVSDELGHRIDPGTFRKFFIETAVQAGIPTARPHDYRHYAASQMMRNGASPVAAAKVLGDLPQTMLNVYCDENIQGKLEALKLLERDALHMVG